MEEMNCKAFPVYPPSSVAPLPTTAAGRAKQEAMASETDHGEALAGAHARYNPHITAIPLLLAPRCLLRPRAHLTSVVARSLQCCREQREDSSGADGGAARGGADRQVQVAPHSQPPDFPPCCPCHAVRSHATAASPLAPPPLAVLVQISVDADGALDRGQDQRGVRRVLRRHAGPRAARRELRRDAQAAARAAAGVPQPALHAAGWG